MAITSLLAVIAIIGQSALQSQARFDLGVDKLVASVASAQNQSTSGVNIVGNGTGSNGCAGGPAGQYVFAGVAWTADNSLAAGSGSVVELQYYEALPGSGAACVFQTQSVTEPADMTVSVGAAPGERELFVRTSNGGLATCPVALAANAAADFAAGSCASGATTLTLHDSSGHSAQVQISVGGTAKRLN